MTSRFVIRRLDRKGNFEFWTDAPGLDVLSLSETASDRVYRLGNTGFLRRVSVADIDALLAGDPVHELGDRPDLEDAIREHIDDGGDQFPKLRVAGTRRQ